MSRRWRALSLAVAFGLACGGPAQRRYEEDLEATPEAAAHRVHGERLADLMRGLERLRAERLPRAMDVELEVEARAERVAQVAEALERSAQAIPAAAGAWAVSAEERGAFDALADELRARAQDLAAQARRRPPGDLEGRVAAVESTCDDCHARFRAGDPRPVR